MRHGEIHEERPDRTAQQIAGGNDNDSQSPLFFKPMRNIGHQRRKAAPSTNTQQQPMGQTENHEIGGIGCDQIACTQKTARHHNRPDNAEPIHHAPDDNGAGCKAQHHQRVGNGDSGTVHAEFFLGIGQDNGDTPHAAASDGGQQ